MQHELNGEAAKAIRIAKGIGVRELARSIHRDPGHISRLERGIHHASAATIAAIANQLGVSYDAITKPAEKEPAA